MVLAVLSLAMILTGCAAPGAAKQEKVKVGFVYTAPVATRVNLAHDWGRKYVEAKLGAS